MRKFHTNWKGWGDIIFRVEFQRPLIEIYPSCSKKIGTTLKDWISIFQEMKMKDRKTLTISIERNISLDEKPQKFVDTFLHWDWRGWHFGKFSYHKFLCHVAKGCGWQSNHGKLISFTNKTIWWKEWLSDIFLRIEKLSAYESCSFSYNYNHTYHEWYTISSLLIMLANIKKD